MSSKVIIYSQMKKNERECLRIASGRTTTEQDRRVDRNGVNGAGL
jgi:hypothetical protein